MKATNAVTLPDETTVGIRLADQADRDALLAGFERLSPTSRFRRFFTGIPYLSDQMVDRLTAIDQHHHVAVGVFDPTRPSDIDRPDGLGVGVGRYIVSDRDQSRASSQLRSSTSTRATASAPCCSKPWSSSPTSAGSKPSPPTC